VRLLEVITDDLLLFGAERLAGTFQPAGEALMELRPRGLGHLPVGGVADQAVPKAVRVLPPELRPVGSDQLLANETRQPLVEAGVLRGGGQHAHRAPREDAARDRSPLEDAALAGA
jgi:hypothetical protein